MADLDKVVILQQYDYFQFTMILFSQSDYSIIVR